MSFIGSMFSGGGNFQAQGANPTGSQAFNPVTGQAQTSVTGAQTSLAQQQALANALASQNGIGNQSAVYGGLGQVAGQLGQIASGQGPNPAAAMLSQSTQANVAQQAAMAAGQRGASSNAGLIARQAGQMGAAAQQTAAGQAATMQANQSLSALGQQANVLGQQGNIAGTQVQNMLGAQQAVTSGQQAQTGQLVGANVAANTAAIQNAQQQNASNVLIAQGNQAAQQSLMNNTIGAGGSLLSSMADGGMVGEESDGIESYGQPPFVPSPYPSLLNYGKSEGGGGGGGMGMGLSMLDGSGGLLGGLLGGGSGEASGTLAAGGEGALDAVGEGAAESAAFMSKGGRAYAADGGITDFGAGTVTPSPMPSAAPASSKSSGGSSSGGGSALMSMMDEGGIANFGAGTVTPSPVSSFTQAQSSSGGGQKSGGSPLALLALMSKGGRVKMASGGTTLPTYGTQWGMPQQNAQNMQNAPASAWGNQFGNSLAHALGMSKTSPSQTSTSGIPGSSVSDYTSLPNTPAPRTPGSSPSDYANLPDVAPPENSQAAGVGAWAKGGKVPAMVSPGEKIIPPQQVKKVARGEKPAIQAGRTVPGKAKVEGNSLKNDTVPKTLAAGSIVLPRSVTQSKNPGPAAQKFVEALLKKEKVRA